jgi:hypothetical protein
VGAVFVLSGVYVGTNTKIFQKKLSRRG